MALVTNKRAYFDYEILEKFEAGLALRGPEVKSIKAGRMQLSGSHIIVRGNQAYLLGAEIAPYQTNNPSSQIEAGRSIQLLLTKKELNRLTGAMSKQQLTIVPLEVYNKRGVLKLTVALVRGKKQYDKRASIKKREANRQMERTLKTRHE